MRKAVSFWFISLLIGTMLVLPVFATTFTAIPTAMTRGPTTLVGDSNNHQPNDGNPSGTTRRVPPVLPKEWTFMVYIAADNNLDPAALDDINEMEMAGSSREVNIVALLDRWDEEYVTGSWIYYITHDEDPDVITSPIVEDLGEVNTGDPDTLRFFVQYVTTNYKAEKYALTLWDHGSGWFGVCWDWTDEDYLTINETQTALTGLPKIDIIGFDACLMSMIEVAYEFTDLADVMVASEAFEPWDGWPYDMFLVDLVTNPGWSAEDLAREIVDDYIASYRDSPLMEQLVTMAATRLAEVPTLGELIDDLALFLIEHLPEYYDAITYAKDSADRYWFGFAPSGPFVDLYHFISLLDEDEDLKTLTDPALDTWKDVVISTKSYGTIHKHALGLTIYFPRNTELYYYPEEYSTSGLNFVTETHWDELLAAYFSA